MRIIVMKTKTFSRRIFHRKTTFELVGSDSPSFDLVIFKEIHHHGMERFCVSTLGDGNLLQFRHITR